MARRLADEDADGLGAVLLADRTQALGGVGEGLVPGDLLEAAVRPFAHRLREAIGIFVDRLHRVGLGAEVSPAPEIVGVAFDAHDLFRIAIDMDLQSAAGFAGRAGAADDFDGHGLDSLAGRGRDAGIVSGGGGSLLGGHGED